ncbi:pentapeptide repeat-containing protein [uncultured Helicobacter sp.]|uniref:pentapeptide repeat-containing protein n=1 Tax=uncultured Helicobacter sp. TaxID=175537 RepID=UPI00374E270C
MDNFEDSAKRFFANIDKAQDEIWHTLFPYLPATPENLAQIQPRIRTKSFLPNEEIPPILEFDIIPNRPLTLNLLRLWRLAKYHLYFTNIQNIAINTMHLDFGNDIQDDRYERKTLGKFTFRGCTFTEIHTMGLCDFEELHFYNCVFKGKVDFADCHFQKLEFQNCVFESSITFDRATFENKAFFTHSTFKDSTSFRHSQCTQGANFGESIFMQKADFSQTRFQDFANFTHTIFNDYADFSQCEFEKTANFYGAKFEKVPNFSQVQFKESLNAVNMDLDFGFTNLKEIISGEFKTHNNILEIPQSFFHTIRQWIGAKDKENIKQKNDTAPTITKPLANFANDFRDSFRIFKNTLIKDNNNLDASEFHRLELYCKEIELGESIHAGGVQAQSEEDVRKNTKPFKESIDWFLLRFYRKLSEHHTDLLRVLNNLVLLIALYAGFVYIGNFTIGDAKTSSISQQLSQNIECLKDSIRESSFIQEYNLSLQLVLIILSILFMACIIRYLIFMFKASTKHTKRKQITFKIIFTGIMKDFRLLLKILGVVLLIFCTITLIVLQFEINNHLSILVNISGFCLFVVLYLWLVSLDSIFLRYIVVIVAYIVASVVLGKNIAILSPLIGQLITGKASANDPLFTAITLAYTILTLLVLFSLQKTARKNSIVPS